MSTGSSIKAPVKHVQLFLEINIRPNSAVIGAAARESLAAASVNGQRTHAYTHTLFVYIYLIPHRSPFLHLLHLS